MNDNHGVTSFQAHGLNLPFRIYTFDSKTRPLYVFFCLWEDGIEKQLGFAETKYHDRLRSVLGRRKGLGQQTLEIICDGFDSLTAAEARVRTQLPILIEMHDL